MSAIASTLGNVLGSLLQSHAARVQGATNENQNAALLAPAIQQDLQELASAVNSGQASIQDAISFIVQLDQTVYQKLQQQVGPAGTAWSGGFTGQSTFVSTNPPVSVGSQIMVNGQMVTKGAGTPPNDPGCNKNCTVGCCIYAYSWEPAFNYVLLQLQRAKSGYSFSVSIGAMQSNKYGFPGFPAYTISFQIPQASTVTSVQSVVNDAANLLTGSQPTLSPSTTGTPQSSSSSNSEMLLLVGGAVILGFALIFGGRRKSL